MRDQSVVVGCSTLTDSVSEDQDGTVSQAPLVTTGMSSFSY